jgi:hypothetical protein
MGDTSCLFRLEDREGTYLIGQEGKAAEVWNSLTLPESTEAHIAFSIATDRAGTLSISANGFDGSAHVLRQSDANLDEDFMDLNETTVFGSSTFTDHLAKPRAVEFYESARLFVASVEMPVADDGMIALLLAVVMHRLLSV